MRMPFMFWKKPFTVTFRGMKYMALHLTPRDEHENIFKKTGYESGRAGLEIAFSFLDPHKASKVDEKKIKCPMLAISADEDRILPPSIIEKIAKKYNANYKKFFNHAHWIIAEPRWEEVALYIHNWINKNVQ